MGSSRFIRGLTWLVVAAIMLSAASPALAAHRFVTGEGSLPPGVTRQSEQGADQSISSSAHWEQDSRTSVPPAAASQALTAATQPTATLALTTTGVVTPANPLAIGGAPDALSNVTPPVLTVAADPVQVTPGEVITYSVAITNVADTLLQSVALSDTLPAGLVYVAQSAVGFDYSLRDNRLTWAVPQMAPGQALRGGFQARVTGLALGELITNTVSATSTATPVVMASALVEVAPPRQNRVWATPGEGGWLRSEDRRVDLRVPRGAVGVRTELRYGAQAGLPELPPHIFFAFALDAVDEQGQAVHEFAAPLTLSAFFDPRQVPPGDLARLALFYFDEASGEWRVLPSRVDRHWRRVTAQVDHFSLFGLGVEAPQLSLSYGAQLLPAVHGFVTDEWSGNSSVSIPIELPPGPGGLGLRLGLSYSSEVVNGLRAGASTYTDPNPPGGVVNQDQSNAMNFNAQASIVGWGWNLSGLGQITRNLQHDKWYLGYAGGGYELINDGVNGWQTEPQSFLRIEQPDRWLVWAPDGTRYTFGSANWGNGMAYVRNTGTCNQQVREAHLTEVLDTHLNKAVITYDTETKDIRCQNGSAQPYVRAIRPASIEYFPSGQTNATVLVDFAYLSRTDTGVPGQNDEYIESFWSSQRLSSITVKVRSGSSSSAFTTVRSYELEQDYLWKDQASSEGLLRLTGVTQKGKDGGPLPAQTFTYTTINDWLNHTLLQTAVNGQGGKITYNYANYGNISIGGCGGENTSRYRVSEMLVEDGLGTAAHNKIQTIYTHQQPYSWASGYPACNDDFEFGGYGFVRKEVKDGAGTLYQVVDNRYHQCGTASPPVACGSGNDSMDPRKGMLYRSITSSQAGSGELARIETTWQIGSVKGRSWVYKAAETQYLGASAQKTSYDYQTALQGNVQYGNATHALTYRDGGTNLLRQQVTEYVPKDVVGGVYIVNRPSRQRLLDATGACQGETRFVYDDQTGYTDPPIKGDLTKVRTALTTCGIPWSDTSYGYDVWGNQTTMTDPRGNTTTTAYDTTAGAWPMLYVLPTSTTAPLVGATSYGWDKVLGQVMSVTDPNNAVTSYEYDQWGRQWKEIRPDDTASNPTARISYTNYTGSSSPFWIKEERRDNASKDGSGNPIPATYLETRTFYDGLGRVVQTQAEAASASQSILADTQYNPLGLAMAQVTPYSYTGALGAYRTPNWTLHRSENSYDALGRVTQSTVKVGGTQISALRTYYQDRKAAVIDPLNHQTIRETDALGRLVSVKQYTGAYTGEPGWSDAFYAESRYGYGVADRLEDVWDPGNNNTHIVYDALGRKTNMTDPDMGAWSYAYDEASNLTRQTDAKNQRLCFYYDALNRLKGKTYSTGVAACPADPGYTGYAVKVYYDTDDAGAPVANGLGRRTGMMDGSSSAAWTYDSRGRVTNDTRTVDGVQYSTSYTYDAMDRPVGAGYVDGENVTYAYSFQGLPKTVVGTIGGTTTSYLSDATFNARGQSTCYRYGQIRQTRLGYQDSSDLRLGSITTGATSQGTTGSCSEASGNAAQNLAYTYDLAGNVKSITDYNNSSQRQCFNYDALDRLERGFTTNDTTCAAANTTIGSGGYDESYAYDPTQGGKTGNLTSKTGVGSYTYGAQASDCPEGVLSKPHGVVTAGSTTYCYDQNGSMRRRKAGTSATTLSYDAENRLTGVSGAATGSFVYDPDGQRVKASFGTGDSAVVSLYVGNHLEMNSVYREGMDDGQAQGWTAVSGTWAVQSGVYRQSNATATNTNTYSSQSQSQMVVVRWKATYTSGTQAGIYLYASSATGAERGNSYRIWQDATTVKIYENVSNVATQRASFTASNAAGQTHTYVARYSPISGRVQVWRDGVRLGGWVDTTPLTSGAYLSLRTDSSDVSFDDIEVYHAKKYYYAGDRRIAMRDNGVLFYLFPDHLGSTNASYRADNSASVVQRYLPWGAIRPTGSNALPTTYTFTGQRVDESLGLMYYGARFYDPYLNRWIQPDTIVPDPGDPQSLNRYSYVLNNPLRYTDSSGHCGPLTPVCIGLLLAGMALLLQGDAPDTNITPEDIASQRLGGALFVGGATLAGGAAVAGTASVSTAGTTAATAACADGDCTNEAHGAGRVAQSVAQATQSVWRMNPLKRGAEIENKVGGRSPNLPYNFPGIDRFENGVATSIKSIDLGATSYQDVGNLTSAIRGYVNALANWSGASWPSASVLPAQISSRELLLAIPPGASAEQMAALQQLQQWAQNVNVTLNMVVIP